tara:strand:+ start:114 stop:644 length:531 start_codon:yes stop_codon:yes gene_type:complete
MNGIEVIENFLKEEDFQQIEKFFLSPRSQWRFIDFVVSKQQDNQKKDGYFVHSFKDLNPSTFQERFVESPNINVLTKIIEEIKKKLNFRQILRIRSSLFPRREYQEPDAFHVDYQFDHKVCIFYINTNNGYTLFKSGEKIDSVANRLLIFDGLKEHSTVVQTDTPARYIINFNLLI